MAYSDCIYSRKQCFCTPYNMGPYALPYVHIMSISELPLRNWYCCVQQHCWWDVNFFVVYTCGYLLLQQILLVLIGQPALSSVQLQQVKPTLYLVSITHPWRPPPPPPARSTSAFWGKDGRCTAITFCCFSWWPKRFSIVFTELSTISTIHILWQNDTRPALVSQPSQPACSTRGVWRNGTVAEINVNDYRTRWCHLPSTPYSWRWTSYWYYNSHRAMALPT